jgi:type II secretory pathway component GspD/PulD (secretin)
MKKNNFFVLSCILLPHLFLLVHAQTDVATQTPEQAAPEPTKKHERLIYFDLREEKLLDIINRLAGEKQINLLLPFDQKKLSETTVTFRLAHKISLTHAWDMVATMLDIAGFSLIKQSNSLYLISPSSTVGNTPAPLYINTSTELLPNSDTVIRYLYFFQNINLKEKDVKPNLEKILTDMLPGQQPDLTFLVDENYNSLVITNKSNVIKSVVNIIKELDQGGFREAIEVIPIIHTSIDEIIKTINNLIPPRKEEETFRFPPMIAEPKGSKTYFSSSTRIVPIAQTNSVAIFGLYESVQRVKDFIQKYLDKNVDAEKTVLHVKALRYLKAEEFATTLKEFLDKKDGTQSTGENKEKILNGVLVMAEKSEEAKAVERKLEGAEKIGV